MKDDSSLSLYRREGYTWEGYTREEHEWEGHGFSRAVRRPLPDCHSEGTSVPEESASPHLTSTKVRVFLQRLWARLQSCPTLVMAVLHEIFDESAYARFLLRHQIRSSQSAYAQFLREQEVAKARRPRCC